MVNGISKACCWSHLRTKGAEHDADCAVMAERERCAKRAEESELSDVHIGPLFNAGWSEALRYIAAKIREGK